MRKLPVGQRLHARESKHDERCCSCWAESETDNHLLQDGLRRDVSHLRFYVLLRAPKTLVREKLKKYPKKYICVELVQL